MARTMRAAAALTCSFLFVVSCKWVESDSIAARLLERMGSTVSAAGGTAVSVLDSMLSSAMIVSGEIALKLGETAAEEDFVAVSTKFG
jgi:hypothetical protein